MVLKPTRRRLTSPAPGRAIGAGRLPAVAQDNKLLTVGLVSDPVTLDPAPTASFFEV